MVHTMLDKNFRLPAAVRPVRYDAGLTVDVAGRRFSGMETIELWLVDASPEIVLHAVELDFTRVACRAAGREIAGSAESVTESETAVLRFREPIPAGPAELVLAWDGRFSPGLRGLYLAGTVAVTQFEAADARRVFPCFDEPSFKAPWTLTVAAPEGLVVLSNGAVVSETKSDGLRRVTFEPTPPLASYLVALACGKLASSGTTTVRQVPVRTWSVPEKVGLTGFGHDVAVEVLPRLEDYFGLPYAFGKLDQLGVPDFEAGAMENAGLITYREAALLLDPVTASLATKKRVAEVVTHELAHQWFGNWVTMAWWDDLWLNEAFATWMAFKIVDAWKPDWRVWLEFDAGKAAALHLDSLRSTHPIRAEVRNAAEAGESFDVITYEKGGAVLRMIEGYLGEGTFRDGIRTYMREHARENAVADDLWGALENTSRQPVVQLANAWIRQGGYPLVRVERRGRTLVLSQRRFFSDPRAMAETAAGPGPTWPVPLVLRYHDGENVREHRVLLGEVGAEVDLAAAGEVAWVCANAGSTGFYRVAYAPADLSALMRNLGALAPAERVGLLADEWALVRAGERDVASFLDLCAGFGGEEDHAVLDELSARLALIEHRLVSDDDRPRFQAFVAALLGAQLASLGWDPRPGEPDPTRLRRAALVRMVGVTAREPAVTSEATRRLDRFFSGDRQALEPNLHDAAVVMAARSGGAARFDTLLERSRTEPDPAFKRRYLLALAAFEEPSQAARAHALALGDAVPLQESASYAAALLANRATREAFWRTLQDQWGAVMARIGGAPMLLRRVIEAVGQLPERRHLEEAEAFLAAHPVETAKQAIAQTLERMAQDVELRERTQFAIGRWLDRLADATVRSRSGGGSAGP